MVSLLLLKPMGKFTNAWSNIKQWYLRQRVYCEDSTGGIIVLLSAFLLTLLLVVVLLLFIIHYSHHPCLLRLFFTKKQIIAITHRVRSTVSIRFFIVLYGILFSSLYRVVIIDLHVVTLLLPPSLSFDHGINN